MDTTTGTARRAPSWLIPALLAVALGALAWLLGAGLTG